MIETLLILILLFEVIRLVLYVRDSCDVRRRNQEAKETMQRANEDWKSLRKAEIEELRILAKDSDTMREIYEDYKARS
uniref:Uncharacterized protein n=1 Tax=viral metagenome TaxID=1070528 RepID=A0A6M3JT97_9ZZZZ